MLKTGRKKIRRIYYASSIILLVITAVSLSIPAYFKIKRELQTKIEQLSKGIIDQKEILLKTIITEKISDIIQLRKDLSACEPNLKNEEFDHVFSNAVRDMIYNTELPDNGYIWINEIIDYQGGDNYAIRLIHPNLMETEGDYLSTKTTDIAGNLPYLEELEGIKAEGEVFYDYYFKKKDLNILSHKLSYAKLYAPNNWIVATGVYLDDVDRLIEAETVNMKASAQKSINSIIFTILSSSVILAGMILLFENRIQAVLNRYLSALQRSNHKIREEKINLEETYKRIENLAYTDFLTELWNRRAISDRIKLEISRTKREKSSFGIIMCDIDYFKDVNDSFGHEAGDYILKSIARTITASIRLEDSAARWGGEEFLLMIVNVNKEQTMNVAEKMRSSIESAVFEYMENEIKLTITAGVSLYEPGDELNAVIKAADKNLYRGKSSGRNKVVG